MLTASKSQESPHPYFILPRHARPVMWIYIAIFTKVLFITWGSRSLTPLSSQEGVTESVTKDDGVQQILCPDFRRRKCLISSNSTIMYDHSTSGTKQSDNSTLKSRSQASATSSEGSTFCLSVLHLFSSLDVWMIDGFSGSSGQTVSVQPRHPTSFLV
jgi:hypothetical protein